MEDPGLRPGVPFYLDFHFQLLLPAGTGIIEKDDF